MSGFGPIPPDSAKWRETNNALRGVIFDLDGTVVDSRLDFDQMRREMRLPPKAPILETLAQMPPDERRRCEAILARHEAEGAQRATLMPGVAEFLAQLDRRDIPKAIITRNTRRLALAVLERLLLSFDPVIAREDAPVKPDPAAIWRICETWECRPAEVVIIGDFHYDMQAGRAAGTRTVLYTQGRPARGLPGSELADWHLTSFDRAEQLLFGPLE